MDVGSTFVAIVAIGSFTGIVAMWLDKRSSSRERQLDTERQLIEQRLQIQEQRLLELERHNDQLEQELTWHRRLAQAEPQRVRTSVGPATADPARAPLPHSAESGRASLQHEPDSVREALPQAADPASVGR